MKAQTAIRPILIAVTLAVMGCLISAESIWYDVYNVPVDRLVANLETLIAKDAKNPEWRVNLARVHVMAYALKSSEIEVARGLETKGPAPKFLRDNEQPAVATTTDPARLAEANAHLAKAVRRFQEAIDLAPDNSVARLGLAWAYQQSREREKAIAAYRAAISVAWPRERDKVAIMGWRSVTEEASRYLVPLLDASKDKAEIVTLQGYMVQLEKMARAITPIVVPLRDGLDVREMVDLSARVRFDADGSNLPRRWTWITPDAGWLVSDPRQERRIQSGLQLFGNVTFWLFWEDGYEAMRALDDDGDGRLRGKELAGLAIWRDANGDGVSDPGEVTSLADWNIVELSCEGVRPAPGEDPSMVSALSPAGVRFGDGTVRTTFDVILQRRK